MKKIAVLGSGSAGEFLSNGFLKHGYEVMRGSRDPSKLGAWKTVGGAKASTATFEEAAAWAELVVLAVKGQAAETVVHMCGSALNGKTVVDTTNPIADGPPTDGILTYFTGPNESLMERLQAAAPAVNFVKSFSCVGAPFMVNPDFGNQKPTMFICGNSDSAKAQVKTLLTQFGWESEDIGKAAGARAIEPLCQLWCAPGFLRNDWTHAFKMLRK